MRASIQRSATFCWSPRTAQGLKTPLLAAGSSADALDDTFSNESKLEIWDPLQTENGQSVLKGSIKTSARFTSIAWGYVHAPDYPKGVIAAGFEDGELGIYDPVKIMDNASPEDALIWSNKDMHSTPIRAMGFNSIKTNVLATGASNGEIWIWDLATPGKPFSPGTRSRNLEDITSLAWNPQHESIFATSSSSGYTVVWDLRTKREFVTLAAPQGQMQGGPNMPQNWMAPAGGRGGSSCVAWHPETSSMLAVSSENDMTPVVFMWDLRNPREPEKTLTGHDKGILHMEWSTQDPDLLITCGKDSRTICWNPTTGQSVGELARGSNWSFRAQMCPQVPDHIAVGSYDGTIGVHSLQATRSEAEIQAERPTGADLFDVTNLNTQSYPAVSLQQAPKWLKRPISATFGFGGKLVIVKQPKQKAPAQGAGPQPPVLSSVSIQSVATEQDLVKRVQSLEQAKQDKDLATLCENKIKDAASSTKDTDGKPAVGWQLLAALFKADSKEEMVSLLGFSKEEVKSKVEEAIQSYKARASLHKSSSEIGLNETSEAGGDDSSSVAREPLVTFADTPTDGLSASSEGEAAAATARSETSFSNLSESTKQAPESEVTEPSLFGDDAAPPQTQQQQNNQATLDFYSQIRSGRPAALPDYLQGETNRADSSVAATIGSRPSSAASGISVKPNQFKIYPTEESDGDRLITRALVLGDFTSAVSLCLSLDRYADALLLAVRGGPELLAKTQKAYFERQTIALPYLRLFQSIVANDLSDIVQNAELPEWQEIFVVLCTFAKADEFASLVEQLGQRLEYQYTLSNRSNTPNLEYRKNAVLCYMAAGKLEKVVPIWVQEMKEDENSSDLPTPAAHAQALQTFIEKVTIFQSAVNYSDVDLAQPTNSAEIAQSHARSYKLATLYDLYREYAELLAAQGLLSSAVQYIEFTPKDYAGTESPDVDSTSVRARLQEAIGKRTASKATAKATPAAVHRAVPNGYGAPVAPSVYNAPVSAYNAPQQTAPVPAQQPSAQPPYMPSQPPNPQSQSPYAPQNSQPFMTPGMPQQMPPQQFSQPQQQVQQQEPYNPYGSNQNAADGGPYGRGPSAYHAPPPSSTPSVAPPPKKYIPDGGWNDAPPQKAAPIQRAPSAARNPIASPFPNMPVPPMPGQQMGGSMPPPPPSRGASGSPAPGRQNFGPPPPRSALSPPPPPASRNAGPPPPRGGAFSPQIPQRGQQMMSPSMPPPPQNFGMPPQPPNTMQQPQYGADSYAPPPGSRPPGPPSMPSQQNQFQNGPSNMPPPPSQMQPGPPQQQRQPEPARAPVAKPEPPKPKYPAGDRSHIPSGSMPIFQTFSERMQFIRQNTPAPQKKMVDDTERRLNVLFDALNCETLSQAAVDGLNGIEQAIRNSDPGLALDLHLQLLQTGVTDVFMPALKILCRSA